MKREKETHENGIVHEMNYKSIKIIMENEHLTFTFSAMLANKVLKETTTNINKKPLTQCWKCSKKAAISSLNCNLNKKTKQMDLFQVLIQWIEFQIKLN